MSTLSYLNGLIDNCLSEIKRYDEDNKRNLERIAEAEAEVKTLQEDLADIKSVIDLGVVFRPEISDRLASDLKWTNTRLQDALLTVIGARQRKENDDHWRLRWHAQAAELRKARDKYKESL